MVCPKYDQLLSDLYNKPQGDILHVIQENAELFKYLTQHTGQVISFIFMHPLLMNIFILNFKPRIQNVTNTNDVEFLYNTLYIEHEMGLKLPEWTKSVFPDKLLPLAVRNLALLSETPYMRKMKGGISLGRVNNWKQIIISINSIIGSLVTDITKKMLSKIEDASKRNILIYSAHDITLSSVVRALDIVNQTSDKPDYGATLAFELHHDPNVISKHFIKVLL